MKSLNQYIAEFVNINNVKRKEYYHPKTTDELVECIRKEIVDNDNTDLNCIDTSDITDMSWLFQHYDKFVLTKEQQETLDISKWDVSSVKNMNYLFAYKYINCDISKWDVSNVITMVSMFSGCEQFNCDISDWDVSNVEDMQGMFYDCKKFTHDLSNWNTKKVHNAYEMFKKSGLEGNEPAWYKKYK